MPAKLTLRILILSLFQIAGPPKNSSNVIVERREGGYLFLRLAGSHKRPKYALRNNIVISIARELGQSTIQTLFPIRSCQSLLRKPCDPKHVFYLVLLSDPLRRTVPLAIEQNYIPEGSYSEVKRS